MRFGPPVSYTHDAKGSALAYQVVGRGDLDLVFVLGWPSHLALLWENPAAAEFLERLAGFSRLILFDRVGTGMSDRGPLGYAFEDWAENISAVLAAVGSRGAALFGCHIGGRMALLFAATHPELTTAVVTFGSHPTTGRSDDYPWGASEQDRENLLRVIREGPDDPQDTLTTIAPSEPLDAVTRRWWATFFRSAASPVERVDQIAAWGPVDIRSLLGAIRVPTLLLHRTGDLVARVEASRYMADRLPLSRLQELPGDAHLPFFGDQDAVLALTQQFLTGDLPVAEPDRAVVTVMFTDIVDSTARATELGDRRWRRLLEEHDAVVRSNLARFRGREIETTGDGFLATFDGPARAIRAAVAIRDQLAELDLRLRVGLHTGECELVDGHVRGIAVHIAARVQALALPGEILCSHTVKDLVAGASIHFVDRGTHRLKGIPDVWPVYSADLTPA